MKKALASDEALQHDLRILQQGISQVHEQLADLSIIKSGLRTVHENIYQLRDDLATSVVKLLSSFGRMTLAAAEAWVRKTFGGE